MTEQKVQEFLESIDKLDAGHYPQMSDVESLPVEGQVSVVHKLALRDFNKAVENSGKERAVFIATDKFAVEMISEWEEYREHALKELGVKAPALIDGVSVKFHVNS